MKATEYAERQGCDKNQCEMLPVNGSALDGSQGEESSQVGSCVMTNPWWREEVNWLLTLTGMLQNVVIQCETQETGKVTKVFQWPPGRVLYLSSCWRRERGLNIPSSSGEFEGKVNICLSFWLLSTWNSFPCLDFPPLCQWKTECASHYRNWNVRYLLCSLRSESQ